jgi:hypothetical protein
MNTVYSFLSDSAYPLDHFGKDNSPKTNLTNIRDVNCLIVWEKATSGTH